MNQNYKHKGLILGLFILFAAMSRLLPHPPNFTAIGAIALFGGAYFSKKWLAFLVPVLAVWITDLILNNVVYAAYYEGFVWISKNLLFTGLAILLMVLLARFVLKKINPGRVIGASLAASVIFFLVSNFGAWAVGTMYPLNIGGLIAAYVAGLPFFLNTLAGDLFFCGVMFGSYALISKTALIPQQVKR
nr:hypothetical protein [Saprospiraceae bacterium]